MQTFFTIFPQPSLQDRLRSFARDRNTSLSEMSFAPRRDCHRNGPLCLHEVQRRHFVRMTRPDIVVVEYEQPGRESAWLH